ncbi:MAG: NAD-dependent epimerase/dehydratase family protein [Caldilineales bacterium]|nr:NAD-dependent epimerase/dehydratase family protein [Caldilineales bacterium]MDW8316430.1 NAD-dependent epimerase/dehydratase family protein [Anaerolineae bacterium]
MSDVVLVTGAAGFTGRHLMDHLRRAEPGATIVAVDRLPMAACPAEVDFRSLDLLDAAAVRRLVAETQPAVVYHLAGLNKSDDPAAFFRVNVLTTLHLLEALRHEAPSAALLAVGSAAEYGPPPDDGPLDEEAPLRPATAYGASKAAQTLLMRSYAAAGLTTFVARPFNLLGPGLPPSMAAAAFAHQIVLREQGLADGPIRVGNLAARRDFLDVRDAVRGYHLIVRRGAAGGVYNVCSGRAVAVQALLDRLVGMARCPVSVTMDPARLQPGDVPLSVGDNRKLMALGWAPQISLEHSLADMVAELRRRPV